MRSCGKIADLLGGYIYGDLGPEEMRRVRLHVESCDSCGQDLKTRTRATALVPDGLPTLSDDERQRVMWTVKGAVRARREPALRRIFSPALVQGFAIAAVVVGAFIAGALIKPPKEVVKEVHVRERIAAPPKPAEPAAESQTDPSVNRPPAGPRIAAEPFVRKVTDATYRGQAKRAAADRTEQTPQPDEDPSPADSDQQWASPASTAVDNLVPAAPTPEVEAQPALPEMTSPIPEPVTPSDELTTGQ